MHCCGRAVKKCQGQSVASRLTVRFYSGGRPAGVGPIHIPKGHYSSGSTAAAAAAAIFWWGGGSMKSVRVCETRKKLRAKIRDGGGHGSHGTSID